MSLRDILARVMGRSGDTGLPPTVDGPTALQLVRDGATLLDVREPAEWKAGHAPKAIHVPLGSLPSRLDRLPEEPPIVVVCASGMRSRAAAKQLRGVGRRATSLSGGIGAWRAAGGRVGR